MNKETPYRDVGSLMVLILFFVGCASTPHTRIDNIPMYGQPAIERPDFLKKADEDFIEQATAGFGSREAASEAWYGQAEKFMQEGNMDYAMRRYNQSWLLNPNNYQPYWGFARVATEQDKFDDAILYIERAKALCDDNYQKVALLADAGSLYSYKAESIPEGRRDERARYFSLANQNFIESTNLDPMYADSWLRWSQSLFREGNYAEAWEKLKKARVLGAKEKEPYLKKLEQKMPDPNK
jgi:tetratricopeptide (TPR) repeat protein